MGYVRTPVVPSVTASATCDNCDAIIDIIANSHGTDALELKLIGGYGMFIDPPNGAVDVLFCKSCSKQLLEAFPCIDRLIDAAY